MDANISMENFNDAVTTVIAAIERGYYSTRDPTPLGPTDWAKLSCALLAVVGRGYHRQYATEYESLLEKVRAEAIDPHPLTTKDGDYYKRLAATVGDLNQHISPDMEGYQDWYLSSKEIFDKKAAKAAAADVDEKWLVWKANQIDKLAADHKRSLANRAREAASPTPFLHRKRTVSGSPSQTRSSNSTPRARSATITRDQIGRAHV